MTVRGFKPWDPRRRPSAEEENRLRQEVERLTNITCSPPLMVERGPGGISFRLDVGFVFQLFGGFWAKITGPPVIELSTAPTGGSIPEGSYHSLNTYSTSQGEFLSNDLSSIDLPAGADTNTITIQSPASITNSTGWYNYLSSSPDGPYYRQGTLNSFGSPLTLTSILTSGSTHGAPFPRSWLEQTPQTNGAFIDTVGGLFGNILFRPAYEVNGNQPQIGEIVWMWRGFKNQNFLDQEYLFAWEAGDGEGGGGGGGKPDLHEIDTLDEETDETFGAFQSVAFDRAHFQVQEDPLHVGSPVVYLCGNNKTTGDPLAHAVMWSGLPDPDPPYAEWTQDPIIKTLQLGAPTVFSGELSFIHEDSFFSTKIIPGEQDNNLIYILPVDDPATVGDEFLKAAFVSGVTYQLYWGPGGSGSSLNVYEVDVVGETTIDSFLSVPSLAVDMTQIDVQEDPLHPTGAIFYLRGMDELGGVFPYCVLHGGEADALPPYGFWTDYPWIGHGVKVGLENGDMGEIQWVSSSGNQSCKIRMKSGAGPITYNLPAIAPLCDGKAMHVELVSGTTWDLHWRYPSIEVWEGGTLKEAAAHGLIFHPNDFNIATQAGGTSPCNKSYGTVETSGFTGTKLVCEGDGTLHLWTFERGLLKTAP